YDTVIGKAKRKTSMGLYPKNKDNESTWAALDFDAHDNTQRDIAESRAIRAFTLLLEYRDRYLILSASGRGYHVFILAREPRPVEEWGYRSQGYRRHDRCTARSWLLRNLSKRENSNASSWPSDPSARLTIRAPWPSPADIV